MTVERKIRAMAGTVVLTSLVLSRVHSEWWLLLTAFAGLNLLQSAFTGFCPPELFFAWRERRRARAQGPG